MYIYKILTGTDDLQLYRSFPYVSLTNIRTPWSDTGETEFLRRGQDLPISERFNFTEESIITFLLVTSALGSDEQSYNYHVSVRRVN